MQILNDYVFQRMKTQLSTILFPPNSEQIRDLWLAQSRPCLTKHLKFVNTLDNEVDYAIFEGNVPTYEQANQAKIIHIKNVLKAPNFACSESHPYLYELQLYNDPKMLPSMLGWKYANQYICSKEALTLRAIFHVYLMCYNEERMLPHVLFHYRQADKIIVLDNESTDNSHSIIEKHEGTIQTYKSKNELNDALMTQTKNTCWQPSRNKCDYVIVCDTDEFVYLPNFKFDLQLGITWMKGCNLAFVKCQGYQMINLLLQFDDIAEKSNLFDLITSGYPCETYSKPAIFNPNLMERSNYVHGCHQFAPVWKVPPSTIRSNPKCPVLLLHYKHIGYEQELARRKMLKSRMSQMNKMLLLATDYLKSDEEMEEDVKQIYFHSPAQDLRPILHPFFHKK